MCNEVHRLFVCLCQISGLPARLHGSHISGHMMSEVLISGKWAWIDAMKGIAPVNDRDEPASAWELRCDPKLFERQPKEVLAEIRGFACELSNNDRDPAILAFQLARNRDCYFHPKEAMALGNYFVWDHARYTYPWRIEPADAERLRKARHGEYLNRKALGWPDYYYNAYLFNGPLKSRG